MALDERRRRHARLFATCEGKSPQQWAAAFLERLARTRRSAA
jgi:trehalose-6-phosphate synthase